MTPAIAALVAVAAIAGSAAAQPALPTVPDLASAGWKPLEFRGRQPTRFASDGPATIRVEAVASSSMLWRPLRIDPVQHRCLVWRWIVDESTLDGTDLGRRGGDDRHLIVSLGFAYDPERAGLGERMRYAMARQQAGREIPARVLFYVWGGRHPRGTWIASPYMDGAGFIRVIEPAPGPRQRWTEVVVDFVTDFEARFGTPVPPVVEVAVGGDTDDTGARTVGRIANIAFRDRC